MKKRIIITGGNGQDGTILSKLLIKKNTPDQLSSPRSAFFHCGGFLATGSPRLKGL